MTGNLQGLAPDPARVAHTMCRCHDRLAGQRRRLESRRRAPNTTVLGAERLLAAGLCVAYLISMVGNLLQIAGP